MFVRSFIIGKISGKKTYSIYFLCRCNPWWGFETLKSIAVMGIRLNKIVVLYIEAIKQTSVNFELCICLKAIIYTFILVYFIFGELFFAVFDLNVCFGEPAKKD